MVYGLGFGVKGLGFRVKGSRFRVEGSGLRVWGLGLRFFFGGRRVQGLGLRVWGAGWRPVSRYSLTERNASFHSSSILFSAPAIGIGVQGRVVLGLGFRVAGLGI